MNAPQKQRPRRIAADEAHAWARHLRLGNPLAKLVLSMTTLYVNGEGSCFVSVEQLSEDCEVAQNTIRSRLAWLEGVGAIARLPQWIDENGRRNAECRGRRTTDEIRLVMSADPDEIEARARGRSTGEPVNPSDGDPAPGEGSTVNVDPSPREGLNEVSPSVALQQPCNSVEGLDSSNQEPEQNPPNPPSGGGRVIDQELESDVADFIRGWRGPITNLPRLRTLLSAMSRDERRKVLVAEKGYMDFLAECERKGKSRAIKDADRWVANGHWQGYTAAGEQCEVRDQLRQVDVDSDEGKALTLLHKIAHMAAPLVSAGKILLKRPLSAQALALINAPPHWQLVRAEDRNQCGAWNDFIARELAGERRPPLITDRNPGGAQGFMAPWPWPPRRDGTIPQAQTVEGESDAGTTDP